MSVFVKLTPYADEPLAAFIARVAAANRYPRAHDILVQAGLKGQAGSIAARAHGRTQQLAQTLGVDNVVLMSLTRNPTDKINVKFFGQTIRARHFDFYTRRLSPKSLLKSEHIKAIWSVNIFDFDPITKEKLISTCPVCFRTLGYTKTSGIAYCDYCTTIDRHGFSAAAVDLRDFPQPVVEVEDEEALDFVTWLVDPDPRRTDESYTINDALTGIRRAELLEMALAIGSALRKNIEGENCSTNRYRQAGMQLSPQELSKVGRILLEWPVKLFEKCDQAVAESSRRPGHFGIFKDIGTISLLPKDPHVGARAQSALREALQLYAKSAPVAGKNVFRGPYLDKTIYIGARESGDILGVNYNRIKKMAEIADIEIFRNSSAKRSPIYFRRDQITPIIDAYKNMIAENGVASRWRLPPHAIYDMVQLGVLDQASGPECDIFPNERYYRSGTLNQFENNFRICLAGAATSNHVEGLYAAMSHFPAGRRPWGAVISLIASGKISATYRNKDKNYLFRSIVISDIRPHRAKILEMMSGLQPSSTEFLCSWSTVDMLGLSVYQNLLDLLSAGYLHRTKFGGIRYSEVISFGAQFILPNEISRIFSIKPHEVRPTMASFLLKPAFDNGIGGTYFYRREEVIAVAGLAKID